MARETNSTYTLSGRISDMQDNALEGLTVTAFDQDPKTPENALGQAVKTGPDGRYSIAFSGTEFRIGGVESGGPDVFIRVFDGDERVGESSVKRNSKKRITINLQLAYVKTDPNEPALRVFGTIRDADGNVLPGITVKAFDRDIRNEEQVGDRQKECQTDSTGYYEITYFTRQFRKREKGSADLVVKAFAVNGSLLVTSPVLFNAPESVERNLTIPAELLLPPTLFERIGQALEGVLDGLSIEELEEDSEHQDLSFLSGETGLEKNVLTRFVMAHKLVQLDIQAEFWFVLLGASFYESTENQSLVDQLKTVVDALPSLNATAIRKALLRGFSEKEIPANLRQRTDEWIEALLALVARRSVSGSDNPTFVKLALDHAGIEDAEKQGKFARLFNEHRALTPELIKALEHDESFNNEEIADVRTSFQLVELTNGDFSVVKMLKDEFDIRQPENIRKLARKSESEWVDLTHEMHMAGAIKLPIAISEIAGQTKLPEAEIYGKRLERRFREAFPTTAFAGGLERALKNGGAHGLRHAETLGRFLDSHENFEFLNTPVDDFLDKTTNSEFQAENFRLEAKAVQRMFKLASNFEATTAMLADNLHSAQQIYRLGESEFVRLYTDAPGFTAETARVAWSRAADTYATVLTLVGDLMSFENETQFAALKFNKDALSSFPNWNNLFKTGDLCDCEECRSVLSPTAYFADLLMFLKDRDADNDPDTKISVKDILFDRRPDLGYLELNCDNAQTRLPYIDVVCEALENAVDATHENDLVLTLTPPVAGVSVETTLKKAFTDSFADPFNEGKEKIALGDNVFPSQVNSTQWVVHSNDVTYLLNKIDPETFSGASHSAKILPNTKATAPELRAYPQYVNPMAYAKLRAAKYPSTLPFDLFAEEVKAAFQKTNLKRWELMRTFRGAMSPNNPIDGDIAAEYFGISAGNPTSDEKSLIFVAKSDENDQKVIWGETGDEWLDQVGNVKTFLQKTSLEYTDLLALLDLKFINPKGVIEINHADDPACDTSQKTLQGLDVEKLDRIHRFLRLWRKLKGWKMWELDLAIHQLKPAAANGSIDEPFLVNLFYFSELKNKLGSKTTVEQALALFGNLNTETYFTKLHEKRADGLYQRLFLNRELIHPLDNAFAVVEVNGSAPTVNKISAHQSVVVAALAVQESDLLLLKGLTRASDGSPYLTDDLTLTSLSFLWRHVWLSKLLKFKVQEWKVLLKIFGEDILHFANPKSALEFLENVEHLKACGFTLDEVNWLLSADRTAKAAAKESDAARFLLALRKQLQAIKAEYNPSRYPFLTVTAPSEPSDIDSLTTLLTSLLQKLNRSDAEADAFVKTLRGSVRLEATMQGLPPEVTFAFPPAITGAPNNIPIRFEQALRFTGIMAADQREILLNDATLNESVVLEVTVQGLPPNFAFPPKITGTGAGNHNIPIQYVTITQPPKQVFRFTGLMTETQKKTLLSNALPIAVLGNLAYRSAIEELYQRSLRVTSTYRSAIEELYQRSLTAAAEYVLTEVKVVLPGGVTLPAELPSIPIHYNDVTNTLSFIGVMSADELGELQAVNTAADASAAIEELSRLPRLAVKFYEPVFTTALETLPPQVDFQAQLPAALAARITYDVERRSLRFSGILSMGEQALLKALAPADEVAYQAAVESLTEQQKSINAPAEGFWLTNTDLDETPAATDTDAMRLAAATKKALNYLSKTYTANAVVELCSAQMGLAEVLTRRLLTYYPVLPPGTLLSHLTGDFAQTTGVVDYATLTLTFAGWFWALRVAAICKKWKITLEELEKLITLTAKLNQAQLLDFGKLPLNESGTMDSLPRFLRTSRLIKLRDSLPESEITLLEVLDKLNKRAYPAAVEVSVNDLPPNFSFPTTITGRPNDIPIAYSAPRDRPIFRFTGLMSDAQRSTLLNDASLGDVRTVASYQQAIQTLFQSPFAVDVERLNANWQADDAESLITSLDMTYPPTYPTDYLLVESWERLSRAFSFLDNLNASASTVVQFAAPAMTNLHAKMLKELLRSKFGAETWLTLSAEIQDLLRERKRDALAAYLLSHAMPSDAPSGKWENTNDLYAYYLLDIEMSSCQLTSRIVQSSGSIQLFVQRCFMGLEPGVVVQADGTDGDSAWRRWTWMQRYQVWRANREIYLYPENWIEPELKKDRSPFFKDMENELKQNEINQFTVETAFATYLEKLDGVAQIEIAGFFQEDDGDNTIVHVFGRTAGAEPHIYYYRRYDYYQWTPWEKVELDIQSDYLIPAIVNKRLYLFWPVFTELAEEAGNIKMSVPTPGQRRFTPDRTTKKLQLQMAVSDYRQGKWTPKKVSKDYAESKPYNVEIVRQNYEFFFIDNSTVDGRYGIQYKGYSVGRNIKAELEKAVNDAAKDESEVRLAKDAADTNFYNAQVAVATIYYLLALTGTLVALADTIVATVENSAIDVGHVWKIVSVHPAGASLASSAYIQAGIALDAIKKAGGVEADASYDTTALMAVLGKLDWEFRAVEAATSVPWQEKLIVNPLTKTAQKTAKDAKDACNEAVRTVTAFKDAAADDAKSAGKELRKAIAATEEAQKASAAYRPEHTHQAVLLQGVFDLSGGTGVPEQALLPIIRPVPPVIQPSNWSTGGDPEYLKWVELPSGGNLTLKKNFPPTTVATLGSHSNNMLVLGETPGMFRMSPSWHLSYFDKLWLEGATADKRRVGALLPFFYSDTLRTFFVPPAIWANNVSELYDIFRDDICDYPDIKQAVRALEDLSLLETDDDKQTLLNKLIHYQWFDFKNFYHPYVGHFAKLINNPVQGIPALMSRQTQDMDSPQFSFNATYLPSLQVLGSNWDAFLPTEQVDFSPDGSYSCYNWELFFHAPLFIANLLSKNQRNREALDWYHFIFNPIGVQSGIAGASPMSKYWITKPFFQMTDEQYVQQRIDTIMRILAGDIRTPDYSDQAQKQLQDQVKDWRTNPFEPHRIANYRKVAYQKNVVMKYLDNLIALGDNLYRQESMETINEATQLYILAAEILGPRPKAIPASVMPHVESFNELEEHFDNFSNALIQVENLVPRHSSNFSTDFKEGQAPLPNLLYFCIPQNDKMLSYWDTVADRLYKIRNCMNIEGVVRQLALFEPRIDPSALVKAIAGGVDINAVLADLNTPLPYYRFNVLLQKANEVCNDLKVLGSALLAALEKKDAEALGALRQSQEIHVLEAVKTVRQQQIDEAKENLAGLNQTKQLVEIKKKYYENKEFMNALEIVSATLSGGAIAVSGVLAFSEALASVFFLLPSFNLGISGVGGSPQVTAQWGSENIAKSIQAANSATQHGGSILSQTASMVGSIANYQRRKEEWNFQSDLANKEMDQVESQLAASRLRIAIAERELDNHVLQIENARATDDFMHTKYTNEELYQWQVGQISSVYFQSYKLAYDLARQAERCFRFEVGVQDSSYISFGYWDSLRKGLLSGEKLQYDLRRLETAFLDKNRREFELTKHISLALLDPLALVKLRETGRCFFQLPEEIFDLDYPGHYFRRIKSVSLTLPCVVGPYTTLSCTLRLLKNSVRINSNMTIGYPRSPDNDDRFIENNIPVKAIATSGAQNDSGMFELSFRDERYLPFEGAGVVSGWSLELFNDLPSNNPDFGKALRQFDYSTISDAILHIKYTAREDAGTFKNGAITHLRDYFGSDDDGANDALRMFSLRQEFPNQWHRFLNPTDKQAGNVFEFEMSTRLFPLRDADKNLKVNSIWLLARCTNAGYSYSILNPPLVAPLTGSDMVNLVPLNQYGGLHFSKKDVSIEIVPTAPPEKWQLKMGGSGGNLQEDSIKKVMEVEDIFLVLGYEWE